MNQNARIRADLLPARNEVEGIQPLEELIYENKKYSRAPQHAAEHQREKQFDAWQVHHSDQLERDTQLRASSDQDQDNDNRPKDAPFVL